MKHRPELVGFLALLAPGSAAASPAVQVESEPGFLAALEDARRVAAAAGEVWPGFDLAAIPIAVFDEQEAWLIHALTPPEGFSPAETTSLSAPVLRGPRADWMSANTAGELDGMVTACISAESLTGGEGDVALILHEAAHAFCARAPSGGPPRWPSEEAALAARHPVDDPVNNAWGRVEGRLLRAALEAPDVAVAALAADFAVARLERQTLLDPELASFEARLEANEGLCDYVALRALERAGRGAGRRAALLAELGQLCVAGAGAERRRFYASGCAQALLLDRLFPDWQLELEERGATQQELLVEMLALYSPAREARAADVAADHGLAALLDFERGAAAAVRAQRRARVLEVLAAPGRKLALELPPQSLAAAQRSFDPMNLVADHRGARLHARMLRLSGDGFELALDVPAVELPELGLVLAQLSSDARLELDAAGHGAQVTAEGLSLACGPCAWSEAPDLVLLRPGAVEAPAADPLRALLAAAAEESLLPLPAAPFELADLAGRAQVQPEPTPRRTALVFLSAAPWARPAHGFARALLAELTPELLDSEKVRLLLVFAQCDRAQVDALLGPDAPRERVVHDEQRLLPRLYGVTSYPTVVWIAPAGTIASTASGNTPENLAVLLAGLRGD